MPRLKIYILCHTSPALLLFYINKIKFITPTFHFIIIKIHTNIFMYGPTDDNLKFTPYYEIPRLFSPKAISR